MGNICLKKKLSPIKSSSKSLFFNTRHDKRKIHPVNNNLANLKNQFFNIEDNFPDKNDITNLRRIYYGGWTISSYPGIQELNNVEIRPRTANVCNRFNLN